MSWRDINEPVGPPRERYFTHKRPPEGQTRIVAPHEGLASIWPDKAGYCGGCGFLSRRAADISGRIEAVSNEARLQTIFLRLSTGEPSKPWCFVRASDLPYEFDDHVEQAPADGSGSTGIKIRVGTTDPAGGAVGGDADRAALLVERTALLRIESKDRNCPEWWPHQDGLTPAEHRAERETMRLEELRAAREERLAAMERQAAADSAKIQVDSLKIQADSLKLGETLKVATDSTDRFTTRWTYAAFLLATVGVILVALTYLFPDLGRHIGNAIVPWLAATPTP